MSSESVRICAKIYKMPLWMHCRKDNKTNAKNNAHCTKNHPQRVSHEHGFRILKCIWAGLWARWAPRPCPHSPKIPPNHDFYSFVCLLVCFVIDSLCIFPKIARSFGVRFCAFGNKLPTKLVNETNSERRFKRARWRGCAQRSWITF